MGDCWHLIETFSKPKKKKPDGGDGDDEAKQGRLKRVTTGSLRLTGRSTSSLGASSSLIPHITGRMPDGKLSGLNLW